MSKAHIVTFSSMLCWAILSVVSRILLLHFGFDPWAFSFVQLCAGGVMLLMISGRGALNPISFLRPMTWVLGALRVVSAALYTTVLASVSVLEAGILGTLNLPIIVIAVWVLSRKRPTRMEWVGHLLILGAIGILVQTLEPEIRYVVAWLMGVNALCLALITLLSERHPDNISDLPGARARFSGAVLLVTAAFFLVARLVQAGPGETGVGMPLLASGVLVGIILRAPAMYLAFWSIRLAGAMGYTAAVTLLPVFGMMFEQMAVAAGLLESSRFRIETLGLVVVVIAGTLLVVRARSSEVSRPDGKAV